MDENQLSANMYAVASRSVTNKMARDAHWSSLWTPDSGEYRDACMISVLALTCLGKVDLTKVCLLNKSEDSDSLLTHVTLNRPPSIPGVPLPPPPAFVEVFCGRDGTTFRPSSVSVISNCRKQELYFGGEYRALLEGESLSTTLQGLVDAEDVEVVNVNRFGELYLATYVVEEGSGRTCGDIRVKFINPPTPLKIFELNVHADVIEIGRVTLADGASEFRSWNPTLPPGAATAAIPSGGTAQPYSIPSHRGVPQRDLPDLLSDLEQRISTKLLEFENRLDAKLTAMEKRLENFITISVNGLNTHQQDSTAAETAPAGDAYVDFRSSQPSPLTDPRYLAYKQHVKEYNDLSFS